MRIAVFPGSFDPFTIGHESIVNRALSLFDKIIIGIGTNNSKRFFIPIEDRVEMIRTLYAHVNEVEVLSYTDLTTEFCKRMNAKFMLRGLRTSADFEYEKSIAQVNQVMLPDVETVFMLTLPEHASINSSVVREVLQFGGDVSKFIPKGLPMEKYLLGRNKL